MKTLFLTKAEADICSFALNELADQVESGFPEPTADYDEWAMRKLADKITETPDLIWRCIWCIRDTKTNPCEYCGSEQVVDRTRPHKPHWSAQTMSTVKCKICDRIAPYEAQLADQTCHPK